MEDREDLGLKAIFGTRFHDDTMAPADASFEPIRQASQPEPDRSSNQLLLSMGPQYEKSVSGTRTQCAIKSLAFGVFNLVLWKWQSAGLMAQTIATPCMWVMVAACGWNACRVIKRMDKM